MAGTGAATTKAPSPRTNNPKFDASDIKLAEIAAELRSKPGPFSIFGIVCAAIALPGALLIGWFSIEIAEVKAVAADAAAASKASAENSSAVRGQIDSLVTSMARMAARPVDNPEKLIALKKLFPADLLVALERQQGGLAYIQHADFDQTQWIFMSTDDFNSLGSSTQTMLRESIAGMQDATDDLNVRLELTFGF